MTGPRALVLIALVLVPSAAWTQGMPLGPEFRINSYTTGMQALPHVASDAAGNFVVVWEGSQGQDGSGAGIFGQRYDNSGTPVGPEFRVNTHTSDQQQNPQIAADSAGNFVVVWRSNLQDGSGSGVFGQRYASSGTPLGPEFRVNSFTTGNQLMPSVASDPAGNFVVVWHSDTGDGWGYGVLGQRFASSGVALGPQFRVNTFTTGSQSSPSAAIDSAGNFVVVWQSDGQDGSTYGTFGQRYLSSGAPLGPEFRINTYTTGFQGFPGVASDSAGNFVAVWSSFGERNDVFGQRYAASGAPLGPEFRVNTTTANTQLLGAVASDPSGNFVVAWTSSYQDGSAHGVWAQRYANSGSPVGSEFRVNTYTSNYQDTWSVATDAAGNFTVTWASFAEDGSGWGVYGQRFGQIVPVELMQFGVQ
jgi:hypothetical protein